MYTIGQFSRICRVTIKALRHYEKVGLLRPARVEPGNQYRYYSREEVDLVTKITRMRELGFSLKVIKQVIDRNPGPDEMRDLLVEQRRLLTEQVQLYNSRLTRLAGWQKTLEANEMPEPRKYDVMLKDIPEIRVRSRRKVLTDFPAGLPALLLEVVGEIKSAGGDCSGAPMTLYYDEEFNPERVDLEVAWPVSDTALATRVLPAVKAATVMHIGPYNEMEAAYSAVYAWINQNGYRALAPMREVNYNDPTVTPPDQLVTEVVVPIEKA